MGWGNGEMMRNNKLKLKLTKMLPFFEMGWGQMFLFFSQSSSSSCMTLYLHRPHVYTAAWCLRMTLLYLCL